MTPDKKPFYAGTYFPKNSRWGRPGLMELLPKIAEVWRNDRNKVNDSADQVTQHIARLGDNRPGSKLDRQTLDQAQAFFVQAYDSDHGGFGQSPKFPSAHQLSFLLRRYHHNQNPQILAMVEKTLTQMRQGGIYDHLGYGFHRYTTDPLWRQPHFEKMLYDQALLATAYLEAYQATGKLFYAGVAEEIITYVLRDMTSTEGGFISAEDAIELNQQMLSHFWDEQHGGLYMTADDGEKLIVRSKSIYDGAIPSGNSVAVFNLLRLGHMTGSTDNLTKAERIIKSFSAEVEQHPAGHSQLMVALEFALNPNYEVVMH